MAKQNKKSPTRRTVQPGVSKVKFDSVQKQLDDANKALAILQAQKLATAEAEIARLTEQKEVLAEKKEPLKPVVPNMLEDAEKKVSEFDGVKVPQLIRPDEAGVYHMLVVVSESDQKTKKFYFNTRVVKLNIAAYEKNKVHYYGVAEEDWYMFHNPLKK